MGQIFTPKIENPQKSDQGSGHLFLGQVRVLYLRRYLAKFFWVRNDFFMCGGFFPESLAKLYHGRVVFAISWDLGYEQFKPPIFIFRKENLFGQIGQFFVQPVENCPGIKINLIMYKCDECW